MPQRNKAQEIRALVAKTQMRLIGRLLLFQRPLARVGDGERTRDHQRLGEAAVLSAREDHAADARIDRQLRELAAERGQLAAAVDRGELMQQLIAVGDRARAGRLEKGKRCHVAQVERCHAQDHRCQRRAQNLRIGETRPCREVLLAVEPHAYPGRDPAAAARALLCRRLRDLFDLEQRHLVAQRVAPHPRQSRIDDVVDAGHCQRSLGNVGRQHDPPSSARREHALLLGDRQPGV